MSDYATIISEYPAGAIPVTATGSGAAGVVAATLPGVVGKTTYISGFEITGTGATLGLAVTPTVTGTVSGTLNYTYAAVAGALLMNTPLMVPYRPSIPASAPNTAIVVTCPSLGTGNTNSTVTAHGYQL